MLSASRRIGARGRLALLTAGFASLVPTGCAPHDLGTGRTRGAGVAIPHGAAPAAPAAAPGSAAPGSAQVSASSTAAPSSAAAHTPASAIRLEGAWIRAGQAGGTTAAYLVIRNAGPGADTLIGAACEAADTVEVHRSFMEGSMMRMAPAGDVPLPAGEQVSLEPGGLHVMLIGLRTDLADGARIPVTLRLAHAGEVTVVAEVRPRAGM